MRLTLRDDPTLGACVVGVGGDWLVRYEVEIAFDRKSKPTSDLLELFEAYISELGAAET